MWSVCKIYLLIIYLFCIHSIYFSVITIAYESLWPGIWNFICTQACIIAHQFHIFLALLYQLRKSNCIQVWTSAENNGHIRLAHRVQISGRLGTHSTAGRDGNCRELSLGCKESVEAVHNSHTSSRTLAWQEASFEPAISVRGETVLESWRTNFWNSKKCFNWTDTPDGDKSIVHYHGIQPWRLATPLATNNFSNNKTGSTQTNRRHSLRHIEYVVLALTWSRFIVASCAIIELISLMRLRPFFHKPEANSFLLKSVFNSAVVTLVMQQNLLFQQSKYLIYVVVHSQICS
jgi:hypothetical protein